MNAMQPEGNSTETMQGRLRTTTRCRNITDIAFSRTASGDSTKSYFGWFGLFSYFTAERALTCVNPPDWPLCKIEKPARPVGSLRGTTRLGRRVPSLFDRLAHIGANRANNVEDKNDSY